MNRSNLRPGNVFYKCRVCHEVFAPDSKRACRVEDAHLAITNRVGVDNNVWPENDSTPGATAIHNCVARVYAIADILVAIEFSSPENSAPLPERIRELIFGR